MLKVTWKFNGRTIPANRVADELGKAVKAKAGDLGRNAIARVRCPVHGTGARNIRAVRTGDRVRYDYEPCCDRLRQTIAERFK